MSAEREKAPALKITPSK
uniref:Uncharacterized protein n=1 Tax=Rhizophora mucronata TaxID=61149 RepID=A0A2P2ITH7_RHIMU